MRYCVIANIISKYVIGERKEYLYGETCEMKVTKPYSFALESLIEIIVERPSEFYVKLAR